jgi:transcriptional regulator with XRE-family HTH domain
MNKYKSMGLINKKKYMKEAGLQSKEVAERMNVRPETISRWASGTHNPGFDQAEQLANILNVSMSDILFKHRGMLIAGTRDYDGNVTMFDSVQQPQYLPIPGLDCPEHRFCLRVETHQQEDKHSYDSFSNVFIKQKVVSDTCYTMRSLVKIKNGPKEFIGKIIQGVIFPMPNNDKGVVLFNLQKCKTKEIIVNIELEWATPMLTRFYNRNKSEVNYLADPSNHDI